MSNQNIVVANADGAVQGRVEIDANELAGMIELQVLKHVMRGATFTAYDITKALRADNPTVEIDHQQVRPCVHDLMINACQVSGYTANLETFPTGHAWQYTLVVAGALPAPAPAQLTDASGAPAPFDPIS